jgi:Xaa-Pro aminopeptidase
MDDDATAVDPPADPVDRADLVAARERRLDDHLDATGREAVWFATPGSFRWASGGGTNVVSRDAGPAGAAALGYVDGDWHVVTDNVEADRIATEEAPAGATLHEFAWHGGDLAAAVADASPSSAAADVDVPGLDRLDPVDVRLPLAPGDRRRYRTLGRAAAETVEAVCRSLTPTDTERGAATALRRAFAARDVATPVVLVGGAERAGAYRHFTPKPVELGDYAVASVSAEWRGLYVSLTRTVAFDPPAWLDGRHAAAAGVEASALAATREAGLAGGDVGDAFAAIVDAYDRHGFDGEWRRHHQGGATGYAGREWFATPGSDRTVDLPAAVAYNPTVQGAKSEDTAIVTGDGIEVVTATGDWPTVTAPAGDGAELDRHGILEGGRDGGR